MFKFIGSFPTLLLSVFVTLPATVLAQGVDVEPNNPCVMAEDVGAPDLPITIMASLDSIDGALDVDFFTFAGEPGQLVQADLRGATSGVGTLNDPYLGLFDASCNLIAVNDDTFALDSQLTFQVPTDGYFILGVTGCCDFAFQGVAEGSYWLTVSAPLVADSISGRLVSARDGLPIPGEEPTFSNVQLFRCFEGACFNFVGFQTADGNGNFRFDTTFSGGPLLAGIYQIQASANGFEWLVTDTFELTEGQALDLGDLALTPFRLIGSVSGQLVDANDGTPLTGFAPPFAVAQLERCDDFGCWGVAGLQTDDLGRFRFEGVQFFLTPGSYRISAFADEYRPTATESFFVDEFEDVDRGAIPLMPSPIQFGAVQGCEIPPGGGLCEYSVVLRNRGVSRFKGEAWSTVDYFPNEFPYRPSRFQVGRVGTTNPMPENLNLKVGESTVLTFQLDVPGNLPDFSTICASATVGRKPDPQFRNSGDRFLFCAVTQSGQIEILSDKEGRKQWRELKRRTRLAAE